MPKAGKSKIQWLRGSEARNYRGAIRRLVEQDFPAARRHIEEIKNPTAKKYLNKKWDEQKALLVSPEYFKLKMLAPFSSWRAERAAKVEADRIESLGPLAKQMNK